MAPAGKAVPLNFKETLKRVPGLLPVVRFARNQREKLILSAKPAEVIFTSIYRENKWGGKDSASGTGSDLRQTECIRNILPVVWHDFSIKTMLDVPCGDFHWMKHAALEQIDYTGADIVAELVEKNKRYEEPQIHFCKINLLKDRIPKFDLIFCRDCLVHLSLKDVRAVLTNICESYSTYLLTTTFTDTLENLDIATGQWRQLNLTLAPFFLPQPIRIINEGCTEGEEYRDKSIGLWRIDAIRERFSAR